MRGTVGTCDGQAPTRGGRGSAFLAAAGATSVVATSERGDAGSSAFVSVPQAAQELRADAPVVGTVIPPLPSAGQVITGAVVSTRLMR